MSPESCSKGKGVAASAQVKLTQTHKRCPGFGKIKLSSDLDGSKFRAWLVAAEARVGAQPWQEGAREEGSRSKARGRGHPVHE